MKYMRVIVLLLLTFIILLSGMAYCFFTFMVMLSGLHVETYSMIILVRYIWIVPILIASFLFYKIAR